MDGIHRIEWPTLGLMALTYGVLVSIVWFNAVLPWWLIMALGSYFAAFHSSLQHEVLHGHPTSNRLLNEALIFPTPLFWMPYGRYRDTHLVHHNDAYLTDPEHDPESYYMLPEAWRETSGAKRYLYQFNQTLFGRMTIGPAVSIARFWPADLARAAHDRRIMKAWFVFAFAAALTIAFIVASGMPLWKYLLLVAYPGISLALVRSYCEHQAAANLDERTIIVEASPFWSLLFLNNNLHATHHARPSLAWYKLPGFHRERTPVRYRFDGYGAIFRRHLFKAKEPIAYPDTRWIGRGP